MSDESTIDPRTPCIIGVAARTLASRATSATRARPSRSRCGRRSRALAAARRGPTGLLEQLDSLQVVYCQTWQYDDAVARLAERLGVEPGAPSLLGHRRHDDPAARERDRRARCSRGELDLALITSAEALATQRPYKKRGERYPYSFRPAEKRPFPWESPLDPIEVAHEVFQAWLTFAVFDNARRAQPRRRPRRLPRRHRRDARADDRGRGRAIRTRGSASRATPTEIVDAARRQPHGRLPVHEVHGRGHGRRHGGAR